MRLAGKNALITGASGGIGSATAIALAREGAAVALSGLEPDKTEAIAEQLRQMGASVYAHPARLHDRAETRALMRAVLAQFGGRLDVLINNAGMSTPEPLEAVSDESFDHQVAVNFSAHFWLAQGAAAAMKAHGRGSIVFISSTGAQAAHLQTAVYDAMKAGLESLTRSLAVELGPHGIRVNAIQPGNIEIDPAVRCNPTAEHRAFWQNIPLQRTGHPEEIANSVVFLASDEASYISGTVLRVDGGRGARMPVVVEVRKDE